MKNLILRFNFENGQSEKANFTTFEFKENSLFSGLGFFDGDGADFPEPNPENYVAIYNWFLDCGHGNAQQKAAGKCIGYENANLQ